MAAWVQSGALLLVLLVRVNLGFPVHQDPNVDASHQRGYDAGPTPAYVGGFSQEDPPSSQFSPAGSPFPAQRHPDPYVYTIPSYSRNVQAEPTAPSRSVGENPWPGYTSSSAQPSSQLDSYQDPQWTAAPLAVPEEPNSEVHYSTRPGAPTSSSGFSSMVPFDPPEFKAGELTHMERSFEHGDYLSETEQQDFQRPPLDMHVSAGPGFSSQSMVLNGGWAVYPYDWMFLTGQYPPGTVTHSSNSFETGSDHWQDNQYIREYPNSAQSQVFPEESQLFESSHSQGDGQVRPALPYEGHNQAPYSGTMPGQIHLRN